MLHELHENWLIHKKKPIPAPVFVVNTEDINIEFQYKRIIKRINELQFQINLKTKEPDDKTENTNSNYQPTVSQLKSKFKKL